MSDAVKDFVEILTNGMPNKPEPFDRQGVVKRVEGRTAFVRFNGSDIETPVQLTIACQPGDTVQTRVAGKNAWLVGNVTAPPTDDRVANEAKRIARNLEKRTTDQFVKIGGLLDEQGEQIGYAIASANGKNTIYHSAAEPTGGEYKEGDTWFNSSEGYAIYTWDGSDWVKEELGEDAIADLSITNAKIANGTIQSAKIGSVDVGALTGGYIAAGHIDVPSLQIGITDVDGLEDALDDAGEASKYVIYSNTAQGVQVKSAANSTNYSQVTAGAFDIYQSGNLISHQGYASGNDDSGGTSPAPYYTFGTRLSDSVSTDRGNYSFVEGVNNAAIGHASHAEGGQTTASGMRSHAEGSRTEAIGQASHASGEMTIAGYDSQFVCGKFNSNQQDNIFEVGCGKSTHRVNGFAVDKYGNAIHRGDGTFDITSRITSVTAGSKVSAILRRFGPVVTLCLEFSNTSTVASGGDLFAAKLNRPTYYPALDVATGGGYYGKHSLMFAIKKENDEWKLIVRNASSASLTMSQNALVTATYFVDEWTSV